MFEPVTVPSLKARLDRARLLAARLRGAREADEKRLGELTIEVSEAKARLDLADEVSGIFEAMQTRAHSRSVGTFEALLSAVLQDVLPEKGNIKLELSNSNNAPNLDIYVDNAGNLEGVLEGSGGAVTNVVSAGLRFAALTRTKNRRLMVLDEPDCWLKPSRVPNFIKVIADVARTTKTQTLLISHHDPAYFRGRVNVVELSGTPQTDITVTVHEPIVTDWESDAQPGLRSIQLINVRAHKDTTLKLYPGVTALIGDNDLGKSTALVSALKAVGYNESDDTLIRHHAKEAQIVIELENHRRLVWTRKAKGSPKVTYALYDGDCELLAEGRAPGRGSVPDWVTAELGISEVDDLDIQVGSQKNPIFLLDQPASRRAQLLSVGRESGHLVKVMDAWGAIKRTDRETVKTGEALVSRLNYRLSRMTTLSEVSSTCDSILPQFVEVEAFMGKSATLERVVRQASSAADAVCQLGQEVAALSGLPPRAPDIADVQVLERLVARIALSQPFRELELPLMQVQAPEMGDTSNLRRIGTRIAELQKYRVLFDVKLPELPDLLVLTSQQQLNASVSRMAALLTGVAATQREEGQAMTEFEKATGEMKELQTKLGGVCPLCDRKFEGDHEHVE